MRAERQCDRSVKREAGRPGSERPVQRAARGKDASCRRDVAGDVDDVNFSAEQRKGGALKEGRQINHPFHAKLPAEPWSIVVMLCGIGPLRVGHTVTTPVEWKLGVANGCFQEHAPSKNEAHQHSVAARGGVERGGGAGRGRL